MVTGLKTVQFSLFLSGSTYLKLVLHNAFPDKYQPTKQSSLLRHESPARRTAWESLLSPAPQRTAGNSIQEDSPHLPCTESCNCCLFIFEGLRMSAG